MPYIGKQLSNGNYLKLDDISSSFNGSTTTFSLTNGGSAYYPGSEFSILVSVGGVIQEPEYAYQISNDEITFANAPTAQDAFFCVVLGDAIGINVPGNNTVNGTQMAKPFNYDGGLLYLNDTDNRVGINSTSPGVDGLDVVGDLRVSGNILGIGGSAISGDIVGNVYAQTGISTFNDLYVAGIATFNGNVSIAGTLTYEDVTNIDSVGFITARTGLRVTDGGIIVTSGVSTFSGAIDANGALDVDGQTDLDVLNVAEIASFSSAVGIADSIFHIGDTDTALRFPTNDTFSVETAGTERIRITAQGNIGIGTDVPYNNGSFNSLSLGGSGKTGLLEISQANGVAGAWLDCYGNTGSGDLRITTAGTSNDIQFWVGGGFAEKVTITSAGRLGIGDTAPATLLEVNSATGTRIRSSYTNTGGGRDAGFDIWADDSGTFASRASLVHSGSAGLTSLYAQNQFKLYSDQSANTIFATRAGKVGINEASPAKHLVVAGDVQIGANTPTANGRELVFNTNRGSAADTIANINWQWNSTNVAQIRGMAGADTTNKDDAHLVFYTAAAGSLAERLRIASTGKVSIGNLASADSLLHIHDGSAGSIAASSAAKLTIESSASDYNVLQFLSPDSAAQQIRFGDASDNGAGWIQYNHNGNVLAFGTAGPEKMRLTSGGNIKLPDSAKIELGGAQTGSGDLQLYFDSAHSRLVHTPSTGDLVIQSDDIYLTNAAGNKYYFRGIQDDRVDIYHNEVIRLTTTSTGITVTGEVSATQDFPMIRPVIDWNFAATKTLDPRIKFTRGGVASYVDDQGIIRYASKNTPRFDHHPTTGESLGILLEKARTNLQEYSVDMDQANHKNAITVTNDFAISPDGTQNASKIVGGGSDANTNIGWNGASVSNSQYGSWSIFLKTDISSCIVQFYTNTYLGGHSRLNLELADGTTGGDAPSSNWRWSVTPYPNGWYRVTWGGNGGNAAGGAYIGVVPSKTSARGATCGSATGKIFYAWGVQEEFNSESKHASSYIPTYGAAASRGADGGVIDGEDFDNFFDRLQGTIVHEFANELQDGGTGGGSGWELNNSDYQKNVITQISSGYSHNGYPGAYAVCYGESADSGDNNISAFGSSSAPDNAATERHGTGDFSRFYKYYRDAMSWKVTPFFTTNILRTGSGGVANETTNTSNISTRNVSQFEFQPYGGNDMAGSYQAFSGRIRRWMYYDKVMTESQLATMTNGLN